MLRISLVLAVSLVLASGCKPKDTGPSATAPRTTETYGERTASSGQSLDDLDRGGAPSTYGDTTADAAPTYSSATSSDEVLTPGGSRTHVVQKGDTLYSIARRYYGDGKRWREILDANSNRVKNPQSLKVGTKLIIP